MKKSNIAFIVIVVLLIVGVSVVMTVPFSNTNYDDFAQCLTDEGAVLYGAYWCHNCDNQKAMFGGSVGKLNYIECIENEAICNAKGITGYPTWIINDQKYVGTQSLETLASVTGCSI